eukprot:1389044-Rhodomonas_salina.3
MRRKELSQPLFQTRPLLARHRLHRVGAHVVAATLEKLPQTPGSTLSSSEVAMADDRDLAHTL